MNNTNKPNNRAQLPDTHMHLQKKGKTAIKKSFIKLKMFKESTVKIFEILFCDH